MSVTRLMTGGAIGLDKADQLLCYINETPMGHGFVSEVDAFLSESGIGHRRFGSMKSTRRLGSPRSSNP